MIVRSIKHLEARTMTNCFIPWHSGNPNHRSTLTEIKHKTLLGIISAIMGMMAGNNQCYSGPSHKWLCLNLKTFSLIGRGAEGE